MTMKKELKGLPPLLVRAPADVKRWIEAEARRSLRSQNNTVVAILRERMEAERSEREAAAR